MEEQRNQSGRLEENTERTNPETSSLPPTPPASSRGPPGPLSITAPTSVGIREERSFDSNDSGPLLGF